VNWSRQEVAAALKAVRSASETLAGRKQALQQLVRAERKLSEKPNPKARVVLNFGERPIGLLRVVLLESPDPAAHSALGRLQKVVKNRSSPPERTADLLHNPLSDARDHRVRHVTGRPRPAR
jgi:hypothetical protein